MQRPLVWLKVGVKGGNAKGEWFSNEIKSGDRKKT